MDWHHDNSSNLWESTEGGWHAVVLEERAGVWNGYVEQVGGDEGDRIYCPQLDPKREHVTAWCMTEMGRQIARQEAERAAG